MHFSTNLQTSNVVNWMNSLMSTWLAEMTATLNSFIYQLANTTSTFIGVVHTKFKKPNGLYRDCFEVQMSQNAATSMP